MAKKLTNGNDIKIFILYLLMNVNKPMLFNDLTQIVLEDGYVDYMGFAECLSELSDTGNVSQSETPDGTLYGITEQGRTVASELQSKIAPFVRTQSLKSALRYISFKEKGYRVPVTSSQNADGSYDMIFGILQNDRPIFDLRLTVDNAFMEQQMRYNFQNDAERIYRAVLSLLSGDADFLLKQ